MLLTIWIPAFAAMTTQVHAQNFDALRHDLDSLFSDTAISNATFGVAIQSLKTGEYLYRLNDMKSLMPASNMKLFTSSEALAMLGPNYRYETAIQTNGFVQDSVLRGDVIINGRGDPTFGDSQDWTDGLIDSLYRCGIRHVEGSIVGDDSYWTTEVYPDGWEVDDIPYYYATPISALNFDENQISVEVSPGDSIGAPARANQGDLDFGYDTLENYAITGPDSSSSTIDVGRINGTNIITVTGSIPNRSPSITEQASISDPTLYAAGAISALWHEANFLSDDTASHLTANAAEKQIVQYTSSPLSEIVRTMNKTSDNLYAECLFRTVAKEIGGEGSWTRGIDVMRKYLATLGIDTTRIQFTDGSGLSRMDLVTADDIVMLLRAMRSNPRLDSAFYNSLPIMGVDGTLENRLRGTPAQWNVHAKTGSMTGVRSISGYLTTRDGEPIAFSILANNYTVPGSEIGKLEDAVLLRLVNFSRK